MKKLRTIVGALFVSVFFLTLLTQNVFAQDPACVQACRAEGNTPAECNAACGGGFRPPPFVNPNDVIKPLEAPTNETFDALNPLQIAGGDDIDDNTPSAFADQLSTPGGIVTRVLVFIFPLAGLILFLMISWGGFEILTGGGDSAKVTAGKQRLTAAIVGFLILFASYWMVQIMEVVFGVIIF